MKQQFIHEHHNRQDKAKKPDYRPEMIERGRSEPSPTPSSKAVARAQARTRLVQEISKHRFVLRGLQFKFAWDQATFARKNNLPPDAEQTQRAMEQMRQAAQTDLDACAAVIKNAPITDDGAFYHFHCELPHGQCQRFPK